MSNNSKLNGPKKMKGKEYVKELRKLQGELCRLQDWVKHKGLRMIIIFEGRDGAGKGGTIRASDGARQSARVPDCRACRRHRTARRRRFTCSVTCSISRRRAKS